MSIEIACNDALRFVSSLEAESIDCVLTDPPYSSGTRKEGQKGVRKSMTRSAADSDWFDNDSLTAHGFAWLMRELALEFERVMKRGAHALIFIDWRMLVHLSGAIESADLRWVNVLVWDKCRIGMGTAFRRQHEFVLHFTKGVGRDPGRRDVPDVLSVPPTRNERHPTQKPVELTRKLLEVVAPPPSTVLDPFVGSGTTAVACQALGLDFVGCERSEQFSREATDRVSGTGELFE